MMLNPVIFLGIPDLNSCHPPGVPQRLDDRNNPARGRK